jgi:uncharacterized protein HemX
MATEPAVMDYEYEGMSAVVTIAVAALSAGTAVASVIAYLYFMRRSDVVAAREEALALAETRRQVIHELRQRLASVEARRNRAKAHYERRIHELQTALDRTRAQARKDAYRTQHFHAAALSDLANDLLSDLERAPPDIESALVRIRRMLTSEPGGRRGAALKN